MELLFILFGFLIFSFGMVVGYFLGWWVNNERSYGGFIVVTKEEGKTLYSLELLNDPEELQFEDRILFKIKAPDGLDRS